MLATAFPPFVQLYRCIYACIVGLTVRVLAAEPAVRSIYLRRGYAKGEWLPGLSDLDFLVVVDELDPTIESRLRRKYSAFSRWALLPDEILEIRNEEALLACCESAIKRYRMMEGRETWRLLHGEDCAARLPALSARDVGAGFHMEASVWWTIFAWRLLQSGGGLPDAVTCNSICYKTVSEILKLELGLDHGVVTFRRDEALALTKPRLAGKDRVLAERLEAAARRRFVRAEPGIVEETFGFLAKRIDALCRHDYGRAAEIEGPCPESREALPWTGDQRRHAETIVEHVSGTWPDGVFLSAHLAASWCHELDECLVLIAVDPCRVPDTAQVRELYELHARAPGGNGRIRIYLLLPNAALQIDADYYSGGWRSVLSPQLNADVFRFAELPAFTLSGRARHPGPDAGWTAGAGDLLRTQYRRAARQLQAAIRGPESGLQFLRRFWKLMQLEILAHSADAGRVVLAHTLGSIEQLSAARGLASVEAMQELAAAYRGELQGASCDIASIASLAAQCLEDLPAPVTEGGSTDATVLSGAGSR